MHRTEILSYISSSEISIFEAMEKIDKNAKGILFVVDSEQKLIGTLSDGDIRRWIIKKGSLYESVMNAMNDNPVKLFPEEKKFATGLMNEKNLRVIPIVDHNARIVGIIERDFNSMESIYQKSNGLKKTPIVVMAGGKGTRLYPYTKVLPKPLIPVGEKTILEHIIERFQLYGGCDFYMVLNHKKNMIKAYLNELEKSFSIHYIDETKPLGTGGGLSLLKGKITETFFLTNCDILIKENLNNIYEYHKKNENVITMVCSLKVFTVPYGVVEMGNEGSVEAMKEKPSFPLWVNTGCYVVEPEIIKRIPIDTEIGFPEIIEECQKKGMKVGVYPISEKAWMDMGQLDTLEDMRNQLENEGNI